MSGRVDPAAFRAALISVAPLDRDAWLDRTLGLDAPPDDGPELPRGGVGYLPCGVEALLHVAEHLRPSDVFVDIGAGVGRAAVTMHLLTGAAAIGIEIQPALVRVARELTARVAPSVQILEGDAAQASDLLRTGSVFLLYCPFGGERLDKVLDELEQIAQTRSIRVCCVDLPLPPRPWLTVVSSPCEGLVIYGKRHLP